MKNEIDIIVQDENEKIYILEISKKIRYKELKKLL